MVHAGGGEFVRKKSRRFFLPTANSLIPVNRESCFRFDFTIVAGQFDNTAPAPLIKTITANSPQNTAILLSSILQPWREMNSEIFSTMPTRSGPIAVKIRCSLSAIDSPFNA